MTRKCSWCKKEKDISLFYMRWDKPHLIQSHCKECIYQKRKNFRLENLERIKLKDRTYHQNNREKRNIYLKKWQTKNKHLRYSKDKARSKKDIGFLMRQRIHNRIRTAIKRNSKHSTSVNLLGCSIKEFIEYFKSKFTTGMNWNKFIEAEIQIDHIVPCSRFDLSKENDQRTCFHYTNLQPLWKEDNLRKKDKYVEVEYL